MVAETLTRSPLVVAPTAGLAGTLKRQYFSYEIGAAVEDGDIFELGYLPKGCLVTGGFIATDDIDTGTEALDIDVGWAANGGASATFYDSLTGATLTNSGGTADPDGFCNVGVMTGDGTGEVYQAGVNYRAFVFPVPLYFSEKTMVQLEANVASAGGHTGTFGVYIDYIMP
jgi:hypothetical protein